MQPETKLACMLNTYTTLLHQHSQGMDDNKDGFAPLKACRRVVPHIADSICIKILEACNYTRLRESKLEIPLKPSKLLGVLCVKA